MRRAILSIIGFAACSSSTPAPAADAPVSTDTWTSWAQGFTTTYCAASCHAAGGSGVRGGALDFTDYTKVFANRAEIRCGVTAVALADCSGFPPPKQFPIAAPYPSDADRTRLTTWIAAGAAQ